MQMAPQVLQSLEYLQAPVMELRAMIQREMEQNPAIEDVESDQDVSLDGTVEEAAAPRREEMAGGDRQSAGDWDDPAGQDPRRDSDSRQDSDGEADAAAEEAAGADEGREMDFGRDAPNDDWDDDQYRDQVESESPSEEAEERRRFMFDSFTTVPTMQESLLSQLADAELSPDELELAMVVVGALDERGYLSDSVDELRFQTGADEFKIAAAIEEVQSLDPAGIGARDLRECLLLQLDRLPASKPALLARRVVSECFDLMAKHRGQQAARALKCTAAEYDEALEVIRKLDPHPGKSVGETAAAVTPEVSVKWNAKEERYEVEGSDDMLPHIRLNPLYVKMGGSADTPAEARAYIREKLNSAKNLISSLQLRQRTITRIAQVIVDSQQDFFEKGVAYLKPMTMADVASQVIGKNGDSMHETTVSRTVASKYMRLPDGKVLPFKYFFSAGLHTIGGPDVSNKAIMDRMRAIIAAEDPAHPLSDQAIADKLNINEDVKIARRTVAKYREALKILSSSMRKKR